MPLNNKRPRSKAVNEGLGSLGEYQEFQRPRQGERCRHDHVGPADGEGERNQQRLLILGKY